jgi:hypothetical protein
VVGVMVDLKQLQHLAGHLLTTIAQDRVHKLNAGYSLNRFSTGHLLDEKGLGTKTWIS